MDAMTGLAIGAVAGALAGAVAPGLASGAARRAADDPVSVPPLPRAASIGALALLGLGFGAAHQDWSLLPILVLLPVGLALSWVDGHARVLPSALLKPALLLVAGLVVAAAVLAGDSTRILAGLLGAVAMFAVYLVLHLISPGSMGFGDVRLAVLLGLSSGAVGLSTWTTALLTPFLLAGLPSLVMMLAPRRRPDTPRTLAFGPAMYAGWVVAVLLGGPIGAWYAGR